MLFKTRGLSKQQLNIIDGFGKFHEMTNVYFQEMIKVAKNNQTKAEHHEFLQTFSKKYIDGYFTRAMTTKARVYFTRTTAGSNFLKSHFVKHLEKVADRIASNEAGGNKKLYIQTLRDLRMIEFNEKTGVIEAPLTKKNIQNGLTKEGADRVERIVTQAIEGYQSSLTFGPKSVFQGFLKERMPKFDSVIKDANGKMIQVYDHKFANTVGNYITGVSKYISTGKTFPMFTMLGGKKHGRGLTEHDIKTLFSKTTGKVALYTMEYQLGMDKGFFDLTRYPSLQNIGAVSAQVGLLSPKAGVKNVLLGIASNVGTHGFLKTSLGYIHAIASEPIIQRKAPKWFKKWTNKSVHYREVAKEAGALDFGHRAYETETRIMDFIFRNVNLMSKGESWNRMTAVYAAEVGLLDKVMIIQKSHGLKQYNSDSNVRRVKDELRKHYYFNEKQIKFLEKMDLNKASDRVVYRDLLARARHFSHVGTQGASNPVFLPSWMNHPVSKSATIFYRIAASVTNGLIRNVGHPLIKHKNPAPLLRYLLTTYGMSELMYNLESWMYNRNMHPADTEEHWSYHRIMANLVKGEGFGIWTEVIQKLGLSPQEDRNRPGPFKTGPFMQPIILNTLNEAYNTISWIVREFDGVKKGQISAGDVLLEGFDMFMGSTVPIYQQGRNVYKYNYKSPLAAKRQDLFSYINQYEKFDPVRASYNEKWVDDTEFFGYEAPLENKNLTDALLTSGVQSKEFEEQFVIIFNMRFNKHTDNGFSAIDAKRKAFEDIKDILNKTNPLSQMSEELLSKKVQGETGALNHRNLFEKWCHKKEEQLGLKHNHIWHMFTDYEDWWKENVGTAKDNKLKKYYWNHPKVNETAAYGNDAGTDGYNEIPGHRSKFKVPKKMNDEEREDWEEVLKVPIIGPLPSLDEVEINGEGYDPWETEDSSNPWLPKP